MILHLNDIRENFFIAKDHFKILHCVQRSCRRAKHAESGTSKRLGTTIQPTAKLETESSRDAKSRGNGCWIPHPRTGIYFPVGHEWVMEDVPDGAANFSQTCWFRNNAVDAVDNPIPKPDAHAPLHQLIFL